MSCSLELLAGLTVEEAPGSPFIFYERRWAGPKMGLTLESCKAGDAGRDGII